MTDHNEKHTPGPWRDDGYNIFGSGLLVATLFKPVVQEEVGMVEANARLIAAAPDLLAALETLEEVAVPDQDPVIMLAATERARAAIAKATGEE